ncbi:MAG: pantoate--beta-alanine ligase [Acidobacteria bacterium]|nr:pantoate--beta-alanine ligase [Acidobacteriota bacterium]
MEITRTPAEMQETAGRLRRDGFRIGFVPTMGYLHEGHLSLVRASKERTDKTVASIFVNPAQFGPNEDLDRYPRDFERDLDMLASAKCNIVFAPTNDGMYPEGNRTFVEVTGLQDGLCGRTRPGHFRGVATVVTKLFNAVQPHVAFFGQKDAQQAAVIRRLVRDLLIPVDIVVCPIVRESDGLAMSSRNIYLSPSERAQAPVLNRSLLEARAMFDGGEKSAGALAHRIRDILATADLGSVEYIEIVDRDSLEPVTELARPALVALAVYFGKTRLIDNIVLGEKGK